MIFLISSGMLTSVLFRFDLTPGGSVGGFMVYVVGLFVDLCGQVRLCLVVWEVTCGKTFSVARLLKPE